MKAAFVLTPAESKRLIARGVVQMPAMWIRLDLYRRTDVSPVWSNQRDIC